MKLKVNIMPPPYYNTKCHKDVWLLLKSDMLLLLLHYKFKVISSFIYERTSSMLAYLTWRAPSLSGCPSMFCTSNDCNFALPCAATTLSTCTNMNPVLVRKSANGMCWLLYMKINQPIQMSLFPHYVN